MEEECTRYDFEDPAARELFQELTYFSSYALGAYGWPVFMYMHPLTGCFNLCQECRWGNTLLLKLLNVLLNAVYAMLIIFKSIF